MKSGSKRFVFFVSFLLSFFLKISSDFGWLAFFLPSLLFFWLLFLFVQSSKCCEWDEASWKTSSGTWKWMLSSFSRSKSDAAAERSFLADVEKGSARLYGVDVAGTDVVVVGAAAGGGGGRGGGDDGGGRW